MSDKIWRLFTYLNIWNSDPLKFWSELDNRIQSKIVFQVSHKECICQRFILFKLFLLSREVFYSFSQLEIRVGHGDHVLRPILIRTFVTALIKYHVHYCSCQVWIDVNFYGRRVLNSCREREREGERGRECDSKVYMWFGSVKESSHWIFTYLYTRSLLFCLSTLSLPL